MKKPAILLYTPRSGSFWVMKYIKKYNEENFNFLYVDNPICGSELFKSNCIYFERKTVDLDFNTLQIPSRVKVPSWNQKVKFLKKERKLGRNYSYKAAIKDIQDIEWFKDFYKDYDVIKIKRGNLWDQYVSYIIQDRNNWNHSYKPSRYNPVEISPIHMTKWLEDYKKFDIILETEVLHYERLSDEVLSRRFQVSFSDAESEAKLVANRKQTYNNLIVNYEDAKHLFYETANKLNVNTI
jgi:hypothetical protein